MADYDVKAQADVKFGFGSSIISGKDKEQLKQLAQTATSLTGYIVEVTGYPDSTGSAATNTKLSEDRAKAVVTFLMQQCGVPVWHIIAPGSNGRMRSSGFERDQNGASRKPSRRGKSSS